MFDRADRLQVRGVAFRVVEARLHVERPRVQHLVGQRGARRVVAPWREWDIRSREDAIAYAAAKNVPVAATLTKIYSRDRNIWHLSHEGGQLENPAVAPAEDMFQLTQDPTAAPDAPEHVTIEFVKGTPVAVNGEHLGPVALLTRLNQLGSRHGVG
ncbi:MAG TPA: hypothetical protein VIP46_14790, partial [Pyrinomonadaceae bacterium]